ncbi:MAG: hypothetical protein JNM34_12915 [Chthonomonadaceae bacterium]|nr:hypothetical protein [Chthonomonadaceae bacterium]
MTIVQWALSTILALFGAYIWVLNFTIFIRAIRLPNERSPSIAPIVGGAALAFGFGICPLPGMLNKAWIPLVIDPVLLFVYYGLIHLTHARSRGE